MARTSNQEHVRRTLEAIAHLRTEPGWHHVAVLAEQVGTKAERLADDLRRVHYSAGLQSVPIMFGDDVEPAHLDGAAVVRFVEDMPITLPLPVSRVELTRIALVADAAASVDPFTPTAAVLRALHARLLGVLDVAHALRSSSTDETPHTVRSTADAIDAGIAVAFDYRSLDDDEATTRRVLPSKVWRAGTGWLLLGHDLDHNGERTFRFDRIVGPVEGIARPEDAPRTLPTQPAQVPRTKVRLRIDADELWAVENYTPTDLVSTSDGALEVTIELYPPVTARLARLLFLVRPGAMVVGPQDCLNGYRAQLRALAGLYGVEATDHTV